MVELLSEEELNQGVRRMANQIAETYGDGSLTILGVLTGSVVLLADIIRLLEMPLRVGVVQARSYRGDGTTRGPLVMNAELMPDVTNRDVLVVDDIFDTGNTLIELLALLQALGPKSIRTAVLMKKKGRCEVDFTPDYVGFDIPNRFVVGYGLDYQDAYRNLPYVAALEDHEIGAIVR